MFFVAKEITKQIKLQIPAGKATPAPPVGTVLGPAGINLQEFCTKYNDATREKMGDIVPVEISIYDDRTFDFVLKTPPASGLIKKYAKISSGSKKGANETVGTLTKDQVKEMNSYFEDKYEAKVNIGVVTNLLMGDTWGTMTPWIALLFGTIQCTPV